MLLYNFLVYHSSIKQSFFLSALNHCKQNILLLSPLRDRRGKEERKAGRKKGRKKGGEDKESQRKEGNERYLSLLII